MMNKLAGFLIATLALVLYPDPASAAPVVAVIGAIAGALAAASAAIGAWAVVTFGVSAAAGAAFGAFVVKLAVGLALYALATALMPKPRVPDPSDRMVNFAQPLSYFETAYGRVRKGGPIGFTGFAEGRRHYTIILAAHRCKTVVEHWLDEWVVEVVSFGAGSGFVTTAPVNPYGSIRFYRGTTTQAVDPQLNVAFPQWTSAHDMTGLSYAAIWAQRPPSDQFVTVYPRSRQWAYAPVIEGRDEIYDPRTNTFGYSNNAALVIADWIVNLLKEQVDWNEVAFEADVCDTPVNVKGGGTVKKWTLNGVINDQEDFENVRAQLGTACDCFFYEREDGKIGFKVGRYIQPDLTLTEDDFYAITVAEGNAGNNNSNEIVIRYSEPNNGYRETPSGVWVYDPLGPDTRQEYAVFWTDNHNQAIRVAKRLSRSIYARYKVTGTLKTTAQNIVGKRFITINNAEIGVSAVFEVNKLVKNEDMLTYEIEAHSVEPEDFDYNAAIEEPIQPAYDKTDIQVTDYTPLSLSGTAVNFSSVPGVELVWTHRFNFLGTDVRYRVSGTTDWAIIANLPSTVLQTVVTPLQDGETYQFQIRATSGQGGTPFSEWFPVTPITVQAVAVSTPPPALQSFTATLGTTNVSLEFLPPNDPLYSATRLYRANYASGYTGPFNFADSSLIQTEYGAPNTTDIYVDSGLAVGVYAYWAIPINASGIAGPTSGPEDVEVV
jgi:hypothetical protein